MPQNRTGYLGVRVNGVDAASRLDPNYAWYDANQPDLSPDAIAGPPPIPPVGGPGDGPNLLEWQESGFPFGSEQSKISIASGEVPGLVVVQKEVREEDPPGINPWPVGVLAEWGWAGIPTEIGVFTIEIEPSSHAGSAGYPGETFIWTIGLAPGCPLIDLRPASALEDVVVDSIVTVPITASNGAAPYFYEVVAGTIPDGLSLSAEGILSGIATFVGDYSFTVRATDDNGCAGIAVFTMSVVSGFRYTIDSIEHPGEMLQADFELGLNQRSTAHVVFGDGYIPDRLSEIVLYSRDGVTPVFGGIILKRNIRGLVPIVLPNATECECVDFSVFFDDATVTLSYDADVSVEDVIADVVDQVLGDYGLTYTPTVTGLTMQPFSWVDVVVTTAFKQISDKTGIVFRTSPAKEILAFVPGADAAPLAITDDNLEHFDLNWSDGERLTANTVELFCGPSGPGLVGQEWMADGIETSWVTDLPAIDPPPILVEVDDGVTPRYATVVPLGEGDGAFEWDRDTHTLSLGTDTLPAAGTILRLGRSPNLPDSPFAYYTVQFPFKVRVALSPATPPIVYRENRPDCVEYHAGVDLALGILARESAPRRDLDVATDKDGFLPGQSLTVNTTSRGGLVGTFLVTAVRAHLQNAEVWDYTIPAQESATYQGSNVDQWKALTNGGSTGAPATVTAPPVDTSAVVESDLALSDVTTANVSTSKHGFVPKAPGDATKFLNGANPPAWAVPSGSGSAIVVQAVSTQTGAASTTTATIPMDDTIPQITEGAEFMTRSITPTNVAHVLRIDVVIHLSPDVANWVVAALFQDSTANALAATFHYISTGTGAAALRFTHWMTAGTTSATTFRVRAGRHTAAGSVTTFNGESGNRRLGGVMASSIIITEIVP